MPELPEVFITATILNILLNSSLVLIHSEKFNKHANIDIKYRNNVVKEINLAYEILTDSKMKERYEKIRNANSC